MEAGASVGVGDSAEEGDEEEYEPVTPSIGRTTGKTSSVGSPSCGMKETCSTGVVSRMECTVAKS